MNKKGFTLIELIVVVIIIGILAATVAPMMLDMTEKIAHGNISQSGYPPRYP